MIAARLPPLRPSTSPLTIRRPRVRYRRSEQRHCSQTRPPMFRSMPAPASPPATISQGRFLPGCNSNRHGHRCPFQFQLEQRRRRRQLQSDRQSHRQHRRGCNVSGRQPDGEQSAIGEASLHRANGSAFTARRSIAIGANAADSGRLGQARLISTEGTTLIGTVTAAPFSSVDQRRAGGGYSLTAKATG